MTNRDLFHATMRFENGEALLHFEQGFMIPYDDWRRDGLPADVGNTHWPKIEAAPDLFDHLTLEHMVDRRQSFGGTATANVRAAIAEAKKALSGGE